MVNRVETIELTGWEQSEVIEEFENDVKKKRDKGWELLSYSRYTNGYEFCIKYEMVRRFPYNV
jgi:hypothetical protein